MPTRTIHTEGGAAASAELLDAWFEELKALLAEGKTLLAAAEAAQAEGQTRSQALFVSGMDRRFEKLAELRARHRQAAIRERLSD